MTQRPGRHREERSEWHHLRHATLLPIAGAVILIAYVLLAAGASLEAHDDSSVPVIV